MKTNIENGVLLFHNTLENRTKKDILSLAANCYYHILGIGKFSFKNWSEKIAEQYDMTDPRNLAIYSALHETEGFISVNIFGTVSIQYNLLKTTQNENLSSKKHSSKRLRQI